LKGAEHQCFPCASEVCRAHGIAPDVPGKAPLTHANWVFLAFGFRLHTCLRPHAQSPGRLVNTLRGDRHRPPHGHSPHSTHGHQSQACRCGLRVTATRVSGEYTPGEMQMRDGRVLGCWLGAATRVPALGATAGALLSATTQTHPDVRFFVFRGPSSVRYTAVCAWYGERWYPVRYAYTGSRTVREMGESVICEQLNTLDV